MSDDCARCRTYAEENARLTSELSGMLHTVRMQADSIAGLKGKRTRQLNDDDLERHVMAILRLHHAVLGSRLLPDGKGADATRTALKKYTSGTTTERRRLCMDAVRGLALRPYVGPHGRTANAVGAKRYTAIKYALGDEDRIAAHAEFYRATRERPLEWLDRAWAASIDAEAHWRWLYFKEWRNVSAQQRRDEEAARIPDRPHLFVVPDQTEEAA